jgi:hypothetical protein
MKEAKFSEVWDRTIKPLLDHKLSKDSFLYTLDDTSNQSRGRRKVESWYNNLRDGIKRDFMRQSDKLLDRHKICACLYIAIVESSILRVKKGTKDKDRLVNADLAFFAASRILFSFMLHEARSNIKLLVFLRMRKFICFPKCQNSDSSETYVVQTIKGLCHAQKHNKLGIFMLANIFRLLEVYTESVYEQNKK